MVMSNQDRVLEKSTTTGTGTYTLSGNPGITGFNTNDFQTFGAIGSGNTVEYCAVGVDPLTGIPNNTGWEVGRGTYAASGTTLARTEVYNSVAGVGTAVNWSAGTRFVFCTRPAEGPLIARKATANPGAVEVQVYHDGSNGHIASTLNSIIIGATDTDVCRTGYVFQAHDLITDGNELKITRNFGIGITRGVKGAYGFGPSSSFDTNQLDIGFVSPEAGVISLVTAMDPFGAGFTPGGMIQNTGGESALNSAFTNNTATFASTNLSLPLIAGRSYRIEGYLIISNSTATEGAQFDFNGGTATATVFDVAISAVGSVTPGTVASTSLAGVLNYTVVTGTDRVFVRGYIKVNAGGTFILRAAENTTALGTFTLAAGSWLAAYDTVRL